METVKFKSEGIVLGYLWGGGKGAYPAHKLSADTKEEILNKANSALFDGSLDSGMGYESLIGALLFITKITTIEIDGKPFTNKETEDEFIGELSEDEQDFLSKCILFK